MSAEPLIPEGQIRTSGLHECLASKILDFAVTHGRARREAAIRQLEFDARAHDDGALAGKLEVFGGVGGDS